MAKATKAIRQVADGFSSGEQDRTADLRVMNRLWNGFI